MKFEEALSKIKENEDKYMRLPFWSDEVQVRVKFSEEGSSMSAPYLYVKSRYGTVPWIPTMIEMFSFAWNVYSDN